MGRFSLLVLLILAAAHPRPASARNASSVKPDSQSVISLEHSLNAQLHPVPVSAVKLPGGFWGARIHLIADRTLPALRQQLEANGTLDNFLHAAGKKNLPRRGRASSDADLYQWIQAASWAIASPETTAANRQKLQADIESLVPLIAAAQDPSGYLDTYFTGDRAHLRFTDLLHSHEDACLEHLLLAGIAYYRATQNRALLDVGIKFADHVLASFGPSLKPFLAAHTKLIGAFVELYRTVGQTKYLDFARYLLGGNERERLRLKEADIRYLFTGRAFTSRTELEGQAVNALDAAAAATDYFTESGDPPYKRTLDLLWNDLLTRRMTVTGAPAIRPTGDTIADPYDVAPGPSPAETQGAAANARWNLRLLALTGDARYGDVLETALYNGVAAGLSQNGGFTCGRGVLSPSEKTKSPYYESENCPPDVLSLFTSVGSYMYASSQDGIYVNLYNDSELDWHLQDGTSLRLTQTTSYPWEGSIRIAVYPEKTADFTLHLRWPAWASAFDVSVNGEKIAASDFQPGAFAAITRAWRPGDVLTLALPIAPVLLRANQHAAELWGKTAVVRGPLVYSLQQADQPSNPLPDLFFRAGASATVELHKEWAGGMTFLKYSGYVADKSASQPLYGPWKDPLLQNRRAISLTFAPFFLSGNRDPDISETWVPTLRPLDAVPPPAAQPKPAPPGKKDDHSVRSDTLNRD
jgi:DUF1680 family protein